MTSSWASLPPTFVEALRHPGWGNFSRARPVSFRHGGAMQTSARRSWSCLPRDAAPEGRGTVGEQASSPLGR